MENIELIKLDYLGEDYPVLAYDSICFGQTKYLLTECKKKEIRSTHFGNQVQIFARTKEEEFKNLILESLTYMNLPEPIVERPFIIIKGIPIEHVESTYFGVYVKSRDLMVVSKKHFSDVIYYIFIKKLPHPKKFKLFDDYDQVEDYVSNLLRSL